MKKIITAAVLIQLVIVGVPVAFSASDKCIVKKTQGNTVVLECSKKSKNFKVDDTVKVKSMRKASVEGC